MGNYGWFAAIVVISVTFNYFIGLAIAKNHGGKDRVILLLAVAANLLSLFYFKYISFVFKSIFPSELHSWADSVHLPLGISFFTFHSISYLVDIYRKDAKVERSISNLALYILMFPQLVAGPILRYHIIAPQLGKRTINIHHLYNGFALFCFGLGQKVLIADTLAGVADPLFARSSTLSSGNAWLASLAYTFQIYYDFSGYSNMAIGLGWISGFHFPPNFNFPYVSVSITEFWRRWHISLSRWFRDYLYIPLGGNRLGGTRTYINLVLVFALCGLWHGAAWAFILWGLYHGSLLVIERIGFSSLLLRLPIPLQYCYTFLLVVVGWVLFRAETLDRAQELYAKMFMLAPSIPDISAAQFLTGEELLAFGLAICFALPGTIKYIDRILSVPREPSPEHGLTFVRTAVGITVSAGVFALASIKIITGAFSPFIYFRF